MMLAQIDLSGLISSIDSQFGAVVTFLSIIALSIFLIWRNQENAKTNAKNADTKRDEADTARDNTINDYAKKYGSLVETVTTQGVALARAEGKVELLNSQLEREREKNQREREELKNAIRNLAAKVEQYEIEITELKASVNGKALEIQALGIECDNLRSQILDLEQQKGSLEIEGERLRKLIDEQAKQITSLGHELMEAKNVATATLTITVPQETKETDKELNQKD